MSRASLNDVDVHSRLIMALQTANAVEKHLRHLVMDGVQAQEAIDVRGARID